MLKKQTLALLFSGLSLSLFAQDWIQKEPVPVTGRHHAAAFSIDGIGYIALGSNVDDNREVHSYDPTTDTWTKLNNFPGTKRGYSVGLSAAGKGWVGFGLGENFSGLFVFKDLWQYTPATDTWAIKANCPCAGRMHPAMVEAGGKIYIGAGQGLNSNLKDFWAYDIATNTWAQKADFPSHTRHHPFYFGIGDYVYVGFGHGTQNVGGVVIYKDFYRYDPATDTWTQLSDFPGQGRVAGTQFSMNGKGYILSGQDRNHVNLQEGELWEYDPATDAWTQLPSMPGSGRWAPTCFTIDNVVYAGMGTSDIDNESDIWAYTFPPISSTDDLTTQTDLAITPNPTYSTIRLNQESGIEPNAVVEIHATNGQSYPAVLDGNNEINVQNLPSGFYFLKVQTSEKVAVGKFLKMD